MHYIYSNYMQDGISYQVSQKAGIEVILHDSCTSIRTRGKICAAAVHYSRAAVGYVRLWGCCRRSETRPLAEL